MRADLIQYYGGGTDALNDPKWKDWNRAQNSGNEKGRYQLCLLLVRCPT
ncbi:MAG: hypothetical protein H6617_00250 [Bdellovibrionaceae bacterium]|nr:hypothetical protein [Pseudobdellovibrionaceae bacterium]